MAVEFSCPYCQQLVRTPLSAAGKKGKCPQCKAVVQIPGGAASEHSAVHATPSRASAQTTSANEAARIEFFCVECGQLVRTPALMAGKKGKCPNCQSLITIPLKAAGSKSSAVMRRSEMGGPKPSWLTPGVELTPLEELTPIGPPPPPSAAGPPDLAPLLDEVLPPLTPLEGPTLARLPVSEWRANLPFAAEASPTPRRRLLDIGRRGLPWERDPTTETFFETVRYVLSAPGDAFLTMRRDGIGSPVGFFLVAAVLGNLMAVVIASVVQLILGIIYIAIADPGQSLFIKWDVLFFRMAAGCCVAIAAAMLSGTVGGLVTAVMYHVSLLVCGGANAGFATTYRVVGFGLGSIYMLASLPIVGPVFAIVMQPIVLTYGFMNAHETSGIRAFLAAMLPMLLGMCCFGFVLLHNWDAIAAAFQEAMERQRLSSGT
jgi:phage FluMu protein Com